VIADAMRLVPLGGAATGSTLYFVHSDHLNTPRVVTNQAQQVGCSSSRCRSRVSTSTGRRASSTTTSEITIDSRN